MRKLTPLLLGTAVLSATLVGCGNRNFATGSAVYGQISNMEGEKVTIKVAELSDDKRAVNQSQIEGLLVLTGKEQVITVSDATEITKSVGEGEQEHFQEIYVGNMVDLELEGGQAKKLKILSSSAENKEEVGDSTGNIALTGSLQVDGKSESSEKESFVTSEENQNAVLVKNAGSLSMVEAKLTKTGDKTSADESSFYGVNAVLATTAGSETSIRKSDLTSRSEGANAIFATGEGALIHASDLKIETSGNNSQGMGATHGGRINAKEIQIGTRGMRCAPVSAGRGGGSVNIKDSMVLSVKEGSPCIYSAGSVIAEGVTGRAEKSPAAIIDGSSILSLIKCNLTSGGTEGVVMHWGISSGALEGTSRLKMTDTTLSMVADGPMFYITNTNAEISLKNTELNFPGNMLAVVTKNLAGNKDIDANKGGNLTFTATEQELRGDIVCDEDSTAVINLSQKATLEGAVNNNKKAKSIQIHISESAQWKLTGDSYVTSVYNEEESFSNITSNGYSIYYDSFHESNSWLEGRTIELSGGGTIAPIKK